MSRSEKPRPDQSHSEGRGTHRLAMGTGELPFVAGSEDDYEAYRRTKEESVYEDPMVHRCVGCHRYYVRTPEEPADEFYCSACLDRPAWDQFTELYSDLGGGG